LRASEISRIIGMMRARNTTVVIAGTCAAAAALIAGACLPSALTYVADAGAAPDAQYERDGEGAGPDAASPYHPISDSTYWTTFDTRRLDAGALSFQGGLFDGRYIYLVPSTADAIVARYDTSAGGGFGDPSSWSTFDAGGLGYAGGVFDGRYLYLVPYDLDGSADGLVARYDTRGDAGFGSPQSWTSFDTSGLGGGAYELRGGAFDGRYVYFVPRGSQQPVNAPRGVVARLDTQNDAGFGSDASWSTFDTTSVRPEARGFVGAVFDGTRYVYLVPRLDDPDAAGDGVVARFDTKNNAGFGSDASWITFDTQTVTTQAMGYLGGVFNGRYLYLVPFAADYAARLDTQSEAGFGQATSWTTFDVNGLGYGPSGYATGAFDGRYVYFAPFQSAVGAAPPNTIFARVDTSAGASFDDAGSWSEYASDAGGYYGSVFDGRYVYFVPTISGIVARFDARDPDADASCDPRFNCSFY
jgi:hypothetical protein